MTSKQKSIQLIERFYFSLPNNGSKSGLCNIHQRWDEAKKCALISVDEILIIMNQEYFTGSEKIEYWEEVRKELLNAIKDKSQVNDSKNLKTEPLNIDNFLKSFD